MTGAAAATVAAAPVLDATAARRAASATHRFGSYPFNLGVASGDPLPDGFVIWTRLAPEPLEPAGGMRWRRVPVRWQVAKDERFRRVVKQGVVRTTADEAHSVHVEVTGLRPWREYFYRFMVGGDASPVGRAKTAPAAGQEISSLSLAVASCQAWYHGFYTAYADMAKKDLDLVLHTGDYIYEYAVGPRGGVRDMDLPPRFNQEIMTLDDYRERHALYRTDPDLQAAHAACAWMIGYDDHEVENNWAGDISENDDPPDPIDWFRARRARAFQAYWEHMPFRAAQRPVGPDIQLYRRLTYGKLAEISLVDTRQYRDDQAGGDGRQPPPDEAYDPSRTMIGDTQERWLLDGFANTRARWTVLSNPTAMSQLDTQPGEGKELGMDMWDGYQASRERVLKGAHDRNVRNLVSLYGDIHRGLAGDLALDFDDPDATIVGSEFGGTSISSGRDGEEIDDVGRVILDENPHVKFINRQRGYTMCTITPNRWQTDYRICDYVTRPGSPVRTRTTLVVEDGRPGIQQD